VKKKRVQQHEKRGERGEEGKRKGKSSDKTGEETRIWNAPEVSRVPNERRA